VERAVMSIDMTPYVNCTQIPKLLSRQGHRLLQIGVGLFLFTSFEGFAIPYLAAPGLGRSVHTLSAFQGVFLLSLGLAWPKLILGAKTSRIAFWLLIYSSFAILAAFVMTGVWGSWQRDNAAGGRSRSWERCSRDRDQGRGVFVCADGSHLLRAHSLGPSHYGLSVTKRTAGASF
jgi:hypothetical protein